MPSDLPVRVIVPHSGAEGFRYAFTSLVSGFPHARALGWQMFKKDLKADHRQSLLSYLWIIFPPLANTLVWVLLNKGDVVSIDTGNIPYAPFVLSGTILWGAFNASIMSAISAVSQARSILAKVNFPHEALFFTAFLKAIVESLVPLLLLVPFLLIQPIPVQSGMALFPLAMASALIFGFACGLIIAPLASFYTDISRGVQLLLRFGFFATPVIFPLPAEGIARKIMLLNPLSHIIVTGRSWLFGSGESLVYGFIGISVAAVVVAILGLLVFKVVLPHLIERISS